MRVKIVCAGESKTCDSKNLNQNMKSAIYRFMGKKGNAPCCDLQDRRTSTVGFVLGNPCLK